MTKIIHTVGFLIGINLLNGCIPSPQNPPQKCDFNVAIQGYDNQRMIISDTTNIVYDDVIGISEKVTEISATTRFSLVTPTEIKIEVDGKKLRKLKIPNCQKLGIVINGRGIGVRLIHMDNFLFN